MAGGVYEKDLSLAISRLNERLFLDTGSDRFVAATMGYCLPGGTVEFESCGQSPLFLIAAGQAIIMPECDPLPWAFL